MSVAHGPRQRSPFHEKYQKQVEEYDKKHSKGPNTTSISVSFPPSMWTSLTIAQDPESRSSFYEEYHKHARGYDKEFAKKYNADLDTTLIFVSFHLHINFYPMLIQ